MPLRQDQAQKAFEKGLINEELYNRLSPQTAEPAMSVEPDLSTNATPAPSQMLEPSVADVEADKVEPKPSYADQFLPPDEPEPKAPEMPDVDIDEMALGISRSKKALQDQIAYDINKRGMSREKVMRIYADAFKDLEDREMKLASYREQMEPQTTEMTDEVVNPQTDLVSMGGQGQARAQLLDPYQAYQGSMGGAIQQQIDLIDREAELEQRKNEAMQNAYAERLGEIEAEQKVKYKTIDENIQNQRKAMQDLNQAEAELAETDIKRDWWANQSTGNKILAGITLALGALGAANTGQNKAAQVIMKAIDDDVALQKANLLNKRQAIRDQKGVVSDLMNRFQDDRQAVTAASALAYKKAALEVENMASKYKSEEIQLKADQLKNTLMTKAMEAQNKLVTMAALQSGQAQNINPMALPKEERRRFVPGFGVALTNKAADTLNQEMIPAANESKEMISRLIEIAQTPAKSVSPQLRAEAQQLQRILMGKSRTALVGPGAVTESEWKILENIIADPTKIFSLDSNNINKLKNFYNVVDNGVQKFAAQNIIGFKGPRQLNFTKEK